MILWCTQLPKYPIFRSKNKKYIKKKFKKEKKFGKHYKNWKQKLIVRSEKNVLFTKK